jgi:Ca-activated chloride channel family protein
MLHIGQFRFGPAIVAAALLFTVAGCSGTPSANDSAPAPYNPYPQPSPRGGGEDRPGIGREIDTAEQPESTFGIDIDTASYNFARRQLLDGHRPGPDTVRPEEFVNAFRQDYAQPSGPGFTVTMDGARLPDTHRASGGGELRLLRVGLQTRAEDSLDRPDAALTFVIDVSGSMAEPGRLDLVQDALNVLIDQLRPTDSVAIVAYSDEAHVIREMTPVRDRRVLHQAVDQLRVEGSTNLEAGLVLGYRVARDGFVTGASNRVILLSDALANVGNTMAEPILRQIREEAGKQIALLGVGVGSQYGDALMERLADAGDGFVTYVSEREQARQLFVTRLPATITVRALDAKVQVVFNSSTVVSYRLIGYENRTLAAEDFDNDRVDGGEVGPGHSVTALYLVRLRPDARGQVAEARVRWLDPTDRGAHERAAAIAGSELDGELARASARLRVDYVAAFFAEVLRQSPYGSEVRLGDLRSLADATYGDTEDPQVKELAMLISRAD